eukprot:6271702-Pyramimonas_sp.AAC.1
MLCKLSSIDSGRRGPASGPRAFKNGLRGKTGPGELSGPLVRGIRSKGKTQHAMEIPAEKQPACLQGAL